jgi:peroxiredoxin
MSSAAARGSRRAREAAAARRTAQQVAHRRRRRAVITVATLVVVLAAVVTAMLLTSKPTATAVSRQAPAFSLTDTSGRRVSLSQYRGRNVVLYFSEGAGCQSCLVQLAEIEKRSSRLDELDVTVLPIVMNSRDQILRDMKANGVRTPFLLDDGAVSRAYGTIGKGMHAGLPGHSFVLIDRSGRQRWYGEYPSMWLAPDDLLEQITEHLKA